MTLGAVLFSEQHYMTQLNTWNAMRYVLGPIIFISQFYKMIMENWDNMTNTVWQ
jgi:hypothetical protein